MNRAIGTTFDFSIPIEKMIPLVAQAGFDRISLAGGNARASGYLKKSIRDRTRRVCRQYSVQVDSIHAPFGSRLDISSPDPGIRRTGVELTVQAIDACVEFDHAQLMLHLNDRFHESELTTRITLVENAMAVIIDYAAKHHVDLAVENLPSSQSARLFDHILSLYDDHRLGVCLDTSHAHLSHTLHDLLEQYGGRLTAVHVSDNRGEHDDHLLPFEGTIDWDRFAMHFARIGYTGTFLLEVEMRESAFHDPEEFLRQAYCRSEKLVKMIGHCDTTC
jgi:L-ribulose-5-phosphate 3-epimerase